MINLWTYTLPSLKERIEDLEPNIEHELENFTQKSGHRVSFNKSARDTYLKFAHSPEALWRANFRDLNSSITRMATLAEGGRITETLVAAEIERLRKAWGGFNAPDKTESVDLHQWLPQETLDNMDLFDQLQLASVIKICQNSRSLAEAGRTLFNVSRGKKSSVNDSHRVKQYLGRFGLGFGDVGVEPRRS